MIIIMIIFLVCMAIGGILGIGGGVWLMAKQKIITDKTGAEIDIEIPLFGKIKTNYPAAIALFLGTFLVYFPVSKLPIEAEKFPVSGEVIINGRPENNYEGVVIGIIPQSHKTYTNNDGTYTIDVYRGENSYTGVAYLREGNVKEVFFGQVVINNGKGTFGGALMKESEEIKNDLQ